MMMEALRILRQVYPNPRRTILVGLWGGEEQGLNGSRAFTEDRPEVVAGLHALFNQDNGTGRVANVSMSGFTEAGAYFARWFAQMPQELVGEIRLDVPGLPSRRGLGPRVVRVPRGPGVLPLGDLVGLLHVHLAHPLDTYDKIVFDDLRQNAVLGAMLAYLASEDDERMPRDRRAGWPECRPAARTAPQG
jgi:carboxypeptidase Q